VGDRELFTCLVMSVVKPGNSQEPFMVHTESWNLLQLMQLVNRPQDTPIFMSLQRIGMCPKEIPDDKTWTGKK